MQSVICNVSPYATRGGDITLIDGSGGLDREGERGGTEGIFFLFFIFNTDDSRRFATDLVGSRIVQK